jgi:D-alanyl-D-alanine carboxypeptidase
LTGDAPGGVAGLEAAIEELTSKPELRHASFGFAVVDAASGDVLFELNGDKLFVTGSLLKSFPTATLLDKWGPDYRFDTPVYGTGPVDAGAISGDLVLVASGDSVSIDPVTGRLYSKVQALAGYITLDDGTELVFGLYMSGGSYPELYEGLLEAGEDVALIAAAFHQSLSE